MRPHGSFAPASDAAPASVATVTARARAHAPAAMDGAHGAVWSDDDAMATSAGQALASSRACARGAQPPPAAADAGACAGAGAVCAHPAKRRLEGLQGAAGGEAERRGRGRQRTARAHAGSEAGGDSPAPALASPSQAPSVQPVTADGACAADALLAALGALATLPPPQLAAAVHAAAARLGDWPGRGAASAAHAVARALGCARGDERAGADQLRCMRPSPAAHMHFIDLTDD